MDDERLTKIEEEKQNALNQSNNTYNSLLNDNQNLYNQQKEYADAYEKTQNEVLDKQLAFQEQQIEKQKETARENMATESKKAKNDYTAYTNPYGYQAESLASSGLSNSGMSETSKLGAYNTYQNRLATANKTMQDAITEYDSAINEARLNNDVQKAQNALSKLQMQLEYSQNYYSNKSTITQNQLSNNQSLDSDYYNRYQTEYSNIQNEKAQAEAIREWEAELAEEQRQYNESLAYQKEQDALEQSNWEREFALSQASSSSSSSSSKSSNSSALTSGSSSLSGSTSANGKTITKNPYTGEINSDAKYGVFDTGDGTGYQPNNVSGSKLSKSGYTVGQLFTGAYGSTGVDLSGQNIWKTNGKYYVWDGSANDYIDVTDKVQYALTHQGPNKW